MSRTERTAFARPVLGWGEHHRRDLPWRSTRDPWRVLVSEVMLQQTQAPRVVEPYGRFIKQFPTPARVRSRWRWRGGTGVGRARVQPPCGEPASGGRGHRRAPRRAGPRRSGRTARAARSGPLHGACRAQLRLRARRWGGRYQRGKAIGASRGGSTPHRARGAASGRRSRSTWPRLGLQPSLVRSGHVSLHGTRPACGDCPLRRRCRWARSGSPLPDPARSSAGASRSQETFAGSDRQGRGRIVAALRSGQVAAADLPIAAGWPEQAGRARGWPRRLVDDGSRPLGRRRAAGTGLRKGRRRSVPAPGRR